MIQDFYGQSHTWNWGRTRKKPSITRHHDKGFIKSIKYRQGYGQELSEDVIDMSENEKAVAQICTVGVRRGRSTSLKGASWSLLLLALLEEATKTSRLFRDRNECEVVDGAI